MAKSKKAEKLDASTEEKIKEAARTVFHKKGFAATRTRDIAEEAGINLALLNYYFRSKARLFEIIMLETVSVFVQTMALALNDEETTLGEKVERVATSYIDLIEKEPDLPIFMLSEIRNNPDLLLVKLPIKQAIMGSVFFRQHHEAVTQGKITEPSPIQFLMNLIGLIMFPFIASPMLKRIGDLKEEDFNRLMQERKRLIPVWIEAMMKAK